MGNSYQKFGKDVVVMGVSNIFTALSSLILLPLLTKTLGTHDYGIWAQVDVTRSLIVIIAALGLPNIMTRFLAPETRKEPIQEQFYSVLSFEFLVALVVSLLLILFADFFARSFFDGATRIVRLTGLICLTGALSGICLTYFKAFRQIKRFAIIIVVGTYVKVGIISFLVLHGYQLFPVVLSVLIVEAALFLFLFFSVYAQIGIKRPRFSRIREYLKLSLPMIPGDFSYWVVYFSDRFIIGYFSGVVSVGVYSAAYGLAYLLAPVAGILSFVLLPSLSKLWDEQRIDETKVLINYSLKYFLTLAIPFLFGAVMLAEPVLGLLSTTEIASQGRVVTPIVALSTIFYGIIAIIAQIFIVVKKTRILGITWITAALVNLCLNLILVPRIGILGAAITTLMAFALAFGVITYYSMKEIKYSFGWGFILKSVIGSAIMSLVVWVLYGILNILLIVVTGVIVYFAVLVLLRGFKRGEWEFAKSLFQKA